MMFPYSPLQAAQYIFGSNGSNLQSDSKRKVEFVKFVDVYDHFFITHPASGQKEGYEHERIMFFSRPTVEILKQSEITGMSEAIANFTSSFLTQPQSSANDSETEYRYITSANSKEVILIVENGSFIIGTSLSRKLCKEMDYFPHLTTIKTLLERMYASYKLFYGPFGNLFNTNCDLFKSNLERFFTPHLHLLRANKTPLIDLFSGVDFLPLENLIFLEIQCLMTSCMEEFACIKKTMFLYQDRLIQYTVEKRDLIILWHFLNEILIPSAMQAELSPENSNRRQEKGKNGFFVHGHIMVDFLGEFTERSFPKVFIYDSNGMTAAFDLIAYRVLNATVCFFVQFDGLDDSHNGFLDMLCDFIDAPMSSIASKIADKFMNEILRPAPADIPYHFIYFNPDSLSLRKSFSSSTSVISPLNIEMQKIPSGMYRMIYETYDKFIADSSLLGQIYVKTEHDWWICFKRVERRFLALFLYQPISSSIVDAENYIEQIISKRFKNLFIS